MHIMYTISHSIFSILDIQFLCKSRHSICINCTQFPVEFSQFWIFKFSANPDILYKLYIQFPVQFTLFWTLNFSANADISNIYNLPNFPLNIRCSGYSIFVLIKTFLTYNVHNFALNFRNSGDSIFQQIQTFRNIMFTISR